MDDSCSVPHCQPLKDDQPSLRHFDAFPVKSNTVGIIDRSGKKEGNG